jgi:hypothetical protein
MRANEDFEKKRKHVKAMVKWGVVLMSSSLVLFFITLFYFSAIFIPAHQGPSNDLITISPIAEPLEVEALIFVLGFLLFLFGLIDLLKKWESH